MLLDIFGVKIWSGYTAEEVYQRLVNRGLYVYTHIDSHVFVVKNNRNDSEQTVIEFMNGSSNAKIRHVIQHNKQKGWKWPKDLQPHPKMIVVN